MHDVAAGLVVIITLIGWILLMGFLAADKRERLATKHEDMRWARADERAKIRARVVALDHAPGCPGAVPGLCWCPIHQVLAVIAGSHE